MRITKTQLRNIIKETGDVYNPDQERADASRGYRNTDSEEEHQIYDEEYGWVTPEELEELTGQMHEHTVKITENQLRRVIRKAINESGYMSGHLQNAVRLDNLDGSSASPATSSRWYEFASLLELDTSDLDTLAFELGLAGFEELETAYSGKIDDRLAERIVDIGSEIFRSPEAAIWDALETVR